MTLSIAANSGANAKKLLVVVLLAGFLLVVLWQNMSGNSSSSSTAAVLVSSPVPTPAAVTSRVDLADVLQAWPAVELPQLLAHNPFQLLEQKTAVDDPASADSVSRSASACNQAKTGSQDTTLTDPFAPPVQINAILSGGRRPAVLIGQRLYYEQDEVAGKWRILTIHPNRVSLELLAAPLELSQPLAVSWSANGGQAPDNQQANKYQAPQ